MNRYLLIVLILMAGFGVQAQKKSTVRAKGSYMSSDLTPEQTRAKAIEDAKRNAMIEAGVSESISFTDFSYKYDDNERFNEIFQAISSIETGGEIIVDEIVSENKYFNEFGNMVVEVEIEATIFRHKKKPDPKFRFSVEGIDEVYKNEDWLQFEFTPTQDGYLKIFNVTDEETYLLYPYKDSERPVLNDDPDRLFEKRQTVQFPVHAAYRDGYYLEIDTPGKSQEFNILMFVFIKENIPFIEEVNFTNMMKWIYAISPDERTTEQHGFVIKKTE
ncbi:MAG: hypothetical protein ACLFPE_11690 [Bacteroidales bacterium]